MDGNSRPAAERSLPLRRPRNLRRLLRGAVASFRPESPDDARMAHRMATAERRGLQLAILCRTIAFALATAFYVISMPLSNSSPTLAGVAAFVTFTLVGVAHFAVVGTRFDREWYKYALLTIDILAVCSLIAFVPASRGADVPQILVMRSFGIHLLFPVIALSALSFSPRLVLWTGSVAVLLWWATYFLIVREMDETLSYSDMADATNAEDYMAVFLSPAFVGTGARMLETMTLFAASAILALVVARARHLFFAHARAEARREGEREARAKVSRQLGRFVPASIVRRVIEDPSGLVPQEREGAVLVMDIEDFTAFAKGKDPTGVIRSLNDFLSDAADVVGEANGVVISFTGDGLLATFNSPLEVSDPEEKALATAWRLLACGRDHGFRLRVGLAAGPMAAGSVGSRERQAFTVYGDTVNRAARLETLAKDLGHAILADDAICAAVETACTPCGRHALRGMGAPVAVWAPVFEGAPAQS